MLPDQAFIIFNHYGNFENYDGISCFLCTVSEE